MTVLERVETGLISRDSKTSQETQFRKKHDRIKFIKPINLVYLRMFVVCLDVFTGFNERPVQIDVNFSTIFNGFAGLVCRLA